MFRSTFQTYFQKFKLIEHFQIHHRQVCGVDRKGLSHATKLTLHVQRTPAEARPPRPSARGSRPATKAAAQTASRRVNYERMTSGTNAGTDQQQNHMKISAVSANKRKTGNMRCEKESLYTNIIIIHIETTEKIVHLQRADAEAAVGCVLDIHRSKDLFFCGSCCTTAP